MASIMFTQLPPSTWGRGRVRVRVRVTARVRAGVRAEVHAEPEETAMSWSR